jgi:hypothetical protein
MSDELSMVTANDACKDESLKHCPKQKQKKSPEQNGSMTGFDRSCRLSLAKPLRSIFIVHTLVNCYQTLSS